MKRSIKKVLAGLLSISVLSFMVACNTNDKPNSESSENKLSSLNSETNSSELSSPDSSVNEEKTSTEKNDEVVIYLTRHGKTMLNTSDRVQGWADSPLTAPGVEVAENLGKGLKLENIQFDAAYSSDSGRAIETANIVLEGVGQTDNIPLVQMKDLREWNFGIFEGDYNENMIEAISEKTGYEGEDDIRVALSLDELANAIALADETGEAEDWAAVSSRIDSAFKTIAQDASENGHNNVLVVAHGMTINTFLKILDPDLVTSPVPNAAVAKITYKDGTFTVETTNDVSYIEKGSAG